MKKLLVGSAAIALGLAVAAPANAQVELGLGGHFKGYVSWVDQDEPRGVNVRDFDILRETEVHFTGETTLDNGLTVGAHIEAKADSNDGFEVDESYAYFSGAWGRVNFGAEDGAAYLLQVAAPSADSNVDGIRQYISPINYGAMIGAATDHYVRRAASPAFNQYLIANGINLGALEAHLFNALISHTNVDYANDGLRFDGRATDKITYLTPVFSGFQFGASYTPDEGNANNFANRLDNEVDEFGDTFEVAARYEGAFSSVGFSLGAGYLHSSLEKKGNTAAEVAFANSFNQANAISIASGFTPAMNAQLGQFSDDFQQWNVGLDLDIAAFGIGAAYVADNGATGGSTNNDTWVVGIDYTTGPFKLGASYLNKEQDLSNTVKLDTDRYSAGVVYTYGPGMTFRGSVGFIDHDLSIAGMSNSMDATYALVGTQINF